MRMINFRKFSGRKAEDRADLPVNKCTRILLEVKAKSELQVDGGFAGPMG